MLNDLSDIDVNRAGLDTAATASASCWAILLGVVIELTEETVAQPLTLGCPRIVSASDSPVNRPGTAIPATDALELVLAIAGMDWLVAHIETAASGADIGANTATQAALGHLSPEGVIELSGPGFFLWDLVRRRK